MSARPTRRAFGVGLAATAAAMTTQGCGAPGETARIACDLGVFDVDYFTRSLPMTPLRLHMARSPARVTSVEVGSAPQALVAYPLDFSVLHGDDVKLRYASELLGAAKSLRSVELFDAHTHESQGRVDLGGYRPLRREACRSWYEGGGFRHSVVVHTEMLAPGLHYAFLTDDTGAQTVPVYFHVRPTAEEVAAADVVILLAEPTWHAYNYYGGGCLYGIHRTDGTTVRIGQNARARRYVASMRRPLLVDPTAARPEFSSKDQVASFFANPANCNQARLAFDGYDAIKWLKSSPESHLVFSRLLRKAGLRTVTLAMTDIDAQPSLVQGAKVVLISGHNEYWTQGMADAFERYVMSGGRVANFSGNVMWWKIKVEDGAIYQDQIGHARSSSCEGSTPAPFKDTGYFHLLDERGPERLFGVNYRFANYPLSSMMQVAAPDQLAAEGVDAKQLTARAGAGVVVARPEHPVFAGLGLSRGERLGQDTGVLDIELDGVPLTPRGEVDRRYSSAFPDKLEILATGSAYIATTEDPAGPTPAYRGVKNVGLVVETQPNDAAEGARVVTFGSIGYAGTLAAGDPRFERIVLNTVQYLLQETLPPVGGRRSAPRRRRGRR